MPFWHSSPASFGGTLPKGEGFGALETWEINENLPTGHNCYLVRGVKPWYSYIRNKQSGGVFYEDPIHRSDS